MTTDQRPSKGTKRNSAEFNEAKRTASFLLKKTCVSDSKLNTCRKNIEVLDALASNSECSEFYNGLKVAYQEYLDSFVGKR